MYSYTFDEETGGILLNGTPTNFSKEPRPVYAKEMDILGFDKYWDYEKQDDTPYMWAEANMYWYRGVLIAKTKGGDLYTKPELQPIRDENGDILFQKENGYTLQAVDIDKMCEKNAELMTVIEDASVKRIVKEYEKFKNKLDIFHVAFSGGKDSAVLLDLVKKALPQGSFVVIFGDTGMEFPDTYETVKITQKQCEEDGTPFYVARSHFDPKDSWKLFGPPSRTLRWCCSVHKSVPQVLLLREITKKDNYSGLAFVGVRKHESATRSTYSYEGNGEKIKGQRSFNPILEWTSAEVWLYLFANNLNINRAYKCGNSRAGCLLCPMGYGKSDYFKHVLYPNEISKFEEIIKNTSSAADINSYISGGGWISRRNGRNIHNNKSCYSEKIVGDDLIIQIKKGICDWKEWIKTLGVTEFNYDIVEDEENVTIKTSKAIDKTPDSKYLKQVFRKAAYCIGCRECEANCPNGSIKFENGVHITDCKHCLLCHDIEKGCLVYHSLELPQLGGKNMKSINTFSSHAPKLEWLTELFDTEEYFFEENSLGTEQKSFFKTFLNHCNLTNNNQLTDLFYLIKLLGYKSNVSWCILLTNLAYQNAQVEWYVQTMDIGKYYDRLEIENLSISTGGVNPKYTNFIITAYGRLCELPLGTDLNFGYVEKKGKNITTLARNKIYFEDNRVLLYALYKFAEKCNLDKEFHVSYLYDETVERDGVSPVRLFGLYDEEELKSMLLGLSSAYPEFINATFTNDLKTITLRDKTSQDVLNLFKEEF